MTVNAPAAIMMAYYVVAAERAGVPRDRLAGTVQADILKEYIAQKEWCFPVDPAMRLMGDLIEWCTDEMPRWHPVSISGYHIREAGSTAAQELAFTLKDGFTYVEQAIERGIDVDKFAPRLSFFFNAQIDFFEEIAKYRAARRIWARELRETYGAENPRSWLMRFHTQTAGVSLTAQQPLNNVVRTAIEALAGVLGGTQSLHTNSYDEALALPSETAVRVAIRTQQIIAHESGVTAHIDPLGGSYAVEAMTDAIEEQAYAYFKKIDELGGMVSAVKEGFPQREIAESSYELQVRQDQGKRIVVGVNEFTEGEDGEMETLRVDPALERKQIDRLQTVRAKRDSQDVEDALDGDPPRRRRRRQPPARVRRRRRGARLGGRDRPGAAGGLGLLPRDPRLLGMAPVYASTIASVVTRSARRTPDAPALTFEDREWTYAELDRAVGRVAAGLLGLGLEKGDRVAAFGTNSDAYVLLFLGCCRAGLVHVPVNYNARKKELEYLLTQSEPKAVFCDARADGVRAARRGPARDGAGLGDRRRRRCTSRTASRTPTSRRSSTRRGTTSQAKGAMLTHRALVHEYVSCITALEITARRRPAALAAALPLRADARLPAAGPRGRRANHLLETPDVDAIFDAGPASAASTPCSCRRRCGSASPATRGSTRST